MGIKDYAVKQGIETSIEFNPEMLTPEEKIRAFCRENKCGYYHNNYMCPPYIGSLEEIRIKLKKFKNGFLLQYSKNIDVKGNREGVIQTKIDFHKGILRVEDHLRESGINHMLGMIGGSCGLCDICYAKTNEPCLFPHQARMSMEAAGIDVVELLKKLCLDCAFHTNKITWTGCILF